MQQIINLSQGTWSYDDNHQLGAAGGFGAVFEGRSSQKDNLAVKRLNLTANAAAHREMAICEGLIGHAFQHVIPVYDAGEDAAHGLYFVVMAKAEKSLQDVINTTGPLPNLEAAKILLEILKGLREVNNVVHRDLKPGNILFHEGLWKVADFGIARFVEESTSPETVKSCLTPAYAAPEQWKYEHADHKTDVYALGCIGYALLTGKPPFPGPTQIDYCNQHLKEIPPNLGTVDLQLQTVMSMMLMKTQNSRPGLERVQELLEKFIQGPAIVGTGISALAKAGVDAANTAAKAEAERVAILVEVEHRKIIASDGCTSRNNIVTQLVDTIERTALNVKIKRSGKIMSIELGLGSLVVTTQAEASLLQKDDFANSKWDVIFGEIIGVRDSNGKSLISASLWYAKLPGHTQFRWYEVSYYEPFGRAFVAYHLTNDPDDADLAASKIITQNDIAFGPVPVDEDRTEEFVNRWASLLAKASQKSLSIRNLPLEPNFWEL